MNKYKITIQDNEENSVKLFFLCLIRLETIRCMSKVCQEYVKDVFIPKRRRLKRSRMASLCGFWLNDTHYKIYILQN